MPVHDDFEKFNVEVEDKDKNSVLNFYRKLINLRSDEKYLKILTEGTYEEILNVDDMIYGFKRQLNEQKIITLVNFSDENLKYNLPEVDDSKILISNRSHNQKGELQPYEAVVYELCIQN